MTAVWPLFTMVGRMVSPRSLRREVYPASQMFVDQFLHRPKTQREDDPPFKKTVVFMPGLVARHHYYQRLSSHLVANKIRFVPVRGLARNTLSWEEAHLAISDTVKMVEDETGEVPVLLLHSKARPDSLGVLAEHPEISRAIFIASPVRGQSYNALISLFSIFGKTSSPRREVLDDPNICDKITTITSSLDCIVPIREATIPNAKNVVIEGREEGGFWNSHTGLPYHAREHIIRLCVEK
ncbi:MAG: hypothetical protein AAB691_03940 [Patescibacteria group bacterium]